MVWTRLTSVRKGILLRVLRKKGRRVGICLVENLDFLRNADKMKNVSTE